MHGATVKIKYVIINDTCHFNGIVNIQYFNLLQYTEIHFNSNNFNLAMYFSTINSWDPNCTKIKFGSVLR